MGHSDKIHREHYRQLLASRDMLKISQYLAIVREDIRDLSTQDTSIQDSHNKSVSDLELEKQNNSEENINFNDEIGN